MSKADPFFHFPLSLLQTAKSTHDLIQDACTMSMLTYGESVGEETRENILQEYSGDYDDTDDDQMAIAVGAVRLHVRVGSVEAEAIKARRLHNKYGAGGMQVRIRNDIAWSAHNDEWPLPKIKTLCGVYAGIGDRPMRMMTRLLIRAHGAGVASPKGLKPLQMLTTKEVRYWTEKLWMQNLFQMAADGQDLWYSHSCKDDRELARIVKAQQTRKEKKMVRTDDV